MAMTKKQKETLDTYVSEMLKLHSLGDKEIAHTMADSILLDALKDLGLSELADAFEQVEKSVGGFWYA